MGHGLPPVHERTIPNLWRRAVDRAPEAPFLYWHDAVISYGDGDALSDGVRVKLAHRGVGRGSHVAVFLPNGPEYVWVLLALAKIGAVAVPIHAEARGKLLAHFIETSDCEFAILGEEFVERTLDAIGPDRLRHVWVLQATPESSADQLRLCASQEELICERSTKAEIADETAAPRFCDTALLMFTSGTSGPSKAAVVAQAHPVTAAIAFADAGGMTERDRLFTCLPMSHANAMWFCVYTAVAVGASVAMVERFSVSKFWSSIAKFRATQTNLLGSMLQLLWKQSPSDQERQHEMNSIFVVPFPSNPADYDARFDVRLQTLYGASEWTPIALSSPGEGYDKPIGWAGPIWRDLNDVVILDDDDLPLPNGSVGEIAVRRKEPFTSLLSYYGREEATLRDFRNLWFHMGDYGFIGDDDCLYFVGRKSDSLRRRGENISAGELEDLLLAMPAAEEVAVVAVPSDLGDNSEDDIAAFVVPSDTGIRPADIVEYARAHLPRYMYPRYVCLTEKLPKTGNEKVRKDELRRYAKENLKDFFDTEGIRP
ncbi:AMP-binding protein [Sciscionella marina]|uniref:AMP-binding protein n=1 Tax=Sciscionella marina TaxID=508770 RepID=UPI0003A813A4|nr:AMP-binding protein [Sciscionella marina]